MQGSLLSAHATAALFLIFLQDWLKRQQWLPMLTYKSKNMNHLFAIVLSGAAVLGIHFSWDAANHSLLITGLSLASIGSGAVSWLQTYLMSKAGYLALQNNLNPVQEQAPSPVVLVPMPPVVTVDSPKKP